MHGLLVSSCVCIDIYSQKLQRKKHLRMTFPASLIFTLLGLVDASCVKQAHLGWSRCPAKSHVLGVLSSKKRCTLAETNSSSLKIDHPKRKRILYPNPIHFQGRTSWFQGVFFHNDNVFFIRIQPIRFLVQPPGVFPRCQLEKDPKWSGAQQEKHTQGTKNTEPH